MIRNNAGQMLIEVLAAIVVAAIVLTVCAGTLMTMSRTVGSLGRNAREAIAQQAMIKTLIISGCSKNGTENEITCQSTNNPDLRQVMINTSKSPKTQTASLEVLIYDKE